MQELYVCKYGGSSVSAPESISKMGEITREDSRRKIIVVSAPSGVTDRLIALSGAGKDYSSIIDDIMDRFLRAHPSADKKVLSDSLEERMEYNGSQDARAAQLRSFGEYHSARLIAESLGYEFVDAANLLLVAGDYDDSMITDKSVDIARSRLLDGRVYVVPGYYGAKDNGEIATFSRGGSDYTGGFLAAALDASVYENFTDKQGVFTFDPNVVPGARKILVMTFKEMRDLAYSGAKIFHRSAIIPIEKRMRQGHSVKVHIRSTMDFPEQGTFVVGERRSDYSQPVVGLAYLDGFCSFDSEVTGMNDTVGVFADMAGLIRDRGISIEHMISGIDDMSPIIRDSGLNCEIGKGADIKAGLLQVLGPDSSVKFQEHMGSLVIAGKGIKKQTTAVTYRLMGALLKAETNYAFMQAGPSQSCIIVGIPSERKERVINAVHDEFFG